MYYKAVIFLDFKKDKYIKCSLSYLKLFLNFLKIKFHIVYIVSTFLQKLIKHYELSPYLIKYTNDVNQHSHPTSVIFIRQITSLMGHYSIKLDITNHPEPDAQFLNVHVDYLSYKNFWNNYNRIRMDIHGAHSRYINNIRETLPKSVIVFDLDETIISYDYQFVCSYVEELLIEARDMFDYMVLWSHGNTTHVQRALKLFNLSKLFDLVLTRGRFQDKCFNKGFGFVLKLLNKNYGISNVKYSVLVDDQEANFNKDYTYFFKVDKKMTNKEYRKNFEILKELINNKYTTTADMTTLPLIHNSFD